MPAKDCAICRPRAVRLRALLAAARLLGCCAWWPWGVEDAQLGGRYTEYDPSNTRRVEGLVVQNGNVVTANFQGKDWNPGQGRVDGKTLHMFGMAGSYVDGIIQWPNGWKWVREGVPTPGGEIVVEGPVPELDDEETCSWKPLSNQGGGGTECYGHNLEVHERSKDAAECLESLARDSRCRFASFDRETQRCFCKHSCPTLVGRASISSFERIVGGISGQYQERSPEGELGKRGIIIQEGTQLSADFPGRDWSPAKGTLSGTRISMFGGSLYGVYANGIITWSNGWKWVYTGKVSASQSKAAEGKRDALGIRNKGWVTSREQTPHIVPAATELVDFPWKDLANITCHVSEEDVHFYDQHGWVILKQVLDPKALDLILDEAQSICKEQLATRNVCQIEQLRWQVNRFRDFMLYSPMGCYAHKLIRGAGVRITTEALFGVQYNDKDPPFFSYGFHVDSMGSHRGIYHAFHSKTKGASVWFPMHDVDPDQTGGSIFVPDNYVGNNASHDCRLKECGGMVEISRSLLPATPRCTEECSRMRRPFRETKRTFKFEKGDAMFFHPEMPHATQPVIKKGFTRHSFTVRLVESDATLCNVWGNCGDWLGCCADLPLKNGDIHNHCFPQIYPQVLDEEVAAHYSSTAKHLMGDPAWNDLAHTIPREPECT